MRRLLPALLAACGCAPTFAAGPAALAHGHNPVAIGMFVVFVAS